MKKLFTLTLLMLSFSLLGRSQSVVINKYYNSGTANGVGDIVELLVVTDNLNMQGMIIKDFSSNMGSDGGGSYTFTNDALWSSVRAGTLIILSRDASSTEDFTSGGSDYNLLVKLANTTYFTPGAGTFDISTTEMVMIKAAGSGVTGTSNSIHVLAGGAAGAQFNAASTPKLRASGTSGSSQFIYANNSTSTLADYNGTDATGAATGLTFGSGNNSTNTTFINSLRGTTTSPTVSVAPGTHAREPSINGSFTITYTPATSSSSTIDYSFTGTATFSTDYTVTVLNGTPSPLISSSGTITVSSGTSTVTLTITPVNDVITELTETIILNISNSSAYTIGTSQAIINLLDDDVAPISLSSGTI
jgi:hypothetical protein